VYAFWRRLENLPLFMKHLSNVTEIDAKHSHWEAVVPGNIGKIKWNAEIVKEKKTPDRLAVDFEFDDQQCR
jgi:uncharacterized membrane protein